MSTNNKLPVGYVFERSEEQGEVQGTWLSTASLRISTSNTGWTPSAPSGASRLTCSDAPPT